MSARMWFHIKSALRNLLRGQRVESELDDEIASYVAAVTDEKIATGLAPEEARRALAECGGTEHVKQAVRNSRAGTLVESLRQDIHFGIRQLSRNPAFAWTAIITLALGIGATTAIFPQSTRCYFALSLSGLRQIDADLLAHKI
ncbi:permease prefix domain 1-containing protein [Edaphobacter modestus]|uniref:Uncharacterized protein n=1 Tax=Edaphobacter modestus TaxID=388466 RepID=A0A4Q7XZ18_9BACT|nr:permease prefix domain 1-containing protein [Edaphobacter modestus]RZU29667.1 hypothetical protein BDD14_6268 [Edaphobacter modestus]